MSKHTPIPWRIHGSFIMGPPREHDNQPANTMRRTPSAVVARCKDSSGGDYSHYPSEIAQANREFIVRAVNNHEALLSALKGVVRVADRKTDEFDAARAAIANAESEVAK
jgi:hypothetical protein